MHSNKTRLLVVDDNASMRSVIRSVLDELGLVDIDEAADGEAALALFTSGDYALVITDLYMPRLDGIGLLRAIRGVAERGDTPVVLLSGDDNPMRGVEALTAGADGFIVKPFIASALLDQVPRLLSRRSDPETGIRDIRRSGPSIKAVRSERTEPSSEPTTERTRDSA